MDSAVGFTQIPNDILESFVSVEFTKRESKIFWAVVRKTFGFKKGSDDISSSQLAKATGLHINHVRTTVKSLEEKKILVVSDGFYGKELGVNPEIDSWLIEPKETKTVVKVTKAVATKTVVKTTKTVARNNQNSCLKQPKRLPTKETITKETITKETKGLVSKNIELVFEYWKNETGQVRAKLDDDRKKKIKCGLANFSVEDCFTAISGCMKTPHNRGDNDRNTSYVSVGVIFKNAEQIERFIGNNTNPPAPRTPNFWERKGITNAKNNEPSPVLHAKQSAADNSVARYEAFIAEQSSGSADGGDSGAVVEHGATVSHAV